MLLAKGRRFEPQILRNFFVFRCFFFLNTVLCSLWREINTFNSKILRCYLVLLIPFLNVKVNQMVISNETRYREAQFSRNCIMEKSCFRYFKIYMIKFHYYNTEKINI